MAAVNPVEIADGENRAVECVVGRRFATDHNERLDRLRLIDHVGQRKRGLGSAMMSKLDHGPACHRKTLRFVQGMGFVQEMGPATSPAGA
jgi:hypothetical protein